MTHFGRDWPRPQRSLHRRRQLYLLAMVAIRVRLSRPPAFSPLSPPCGGGGGKWRRRRPTTPKDRRPGERCRTGHSAHPRPSRPAARTHKLYTVRTRKPADCTACAQGPSAAPTELADPAVRTALTGPCAVGTPHPTTSLSHAETGYAFRMPQRARCQARSTSEMPGEIRPPAAPSPRPPLPAITRRARLGPARSLGGPSGRQSLGGPSLGGPSGRPLRSRCGGASAT